MKKILPLILIIVLIFASSIFIRAHDSKFNLNGYRLYIDAGHGGKDNGASYGDILEDEINLRISCYLVEALILAGADVITSRNGDYDLASNYDRNRKAKDLKRRVELINMIKPDLFISIHLNTYSLDSSVRGGQVFFQNNDKSRMIASLLQERFNALSNKDKKPKLGNYYLLNNTNSVGLIVECGFLTNDSDRVNLNNDEYQKKIANEVVIAIGEYFYKSS